MLQRVQPALIGLIDGTVSTLAPIFATAFLAGSHAALFVGLAAALGAAISMGLSEALSDDGPVSGRGSSLSRGLMTGDRDRLDPQALPGRVAPQLPDPGDYGRNDRCRHRGDDRPGLTATGPPYQREMTTFLRV